MKNKKIQAVLMLGIFTGALLYYLWAGRYSYLHFPVLLAVEVVCLGLMAWSHFLFKTDLASLGLGFRNFLKAGKWYGTLTIAGCLGIAAIGRENPDLNLRILEEAPGYLAWAAVQQYALQNFFLRLSLIIFTPGKEEAGARAGMPMSLKTRILSSLLSAAAFSLFHFPSPAFVAVTFTAAFFWCLFYTARPSYYWAWLSHFLLGVCLSFFLKTGLMGELQVGPGGFRYESYGDGVTVAAGYDKKGKPFIAAVPGPDRGNHSCIRIFSSRGETLAEWTAFEEYDFSAMIAVGDVGFGPGDEIIAVPGPGSENPPVVRIFNPSGGLLREFRIDDPDFPDSYGLSVNVENGKIYLAPGPAPRSSQILAEYSLDGSMIRKWSLPEGKVTENISFQNGLRGFVMDGPEPVLLRWGSGIAVNPSVVAAADPEDGDIGYLIETFPTTYGVNLALVELGDGELGIAAAPGPLKGYPPWIKVFSAAENWKPVRDMASWEDEGSCGLNLSAVDINGDGIDELVAGEGWGRDRPALVRIVTLEGEIVSQWEAF